MARKGRMSENISDHDAYYKGTIFERTQNIRSRQGKELLSDEDVLILTCAEIYRTFTHEERGYRT